MIDYLKYFFNPAHLFSLRPQAMETRAIIILAIFFAVLVIGGIITKFIGSKTKDGLKLKGLRRLVSMLLTMGIIGFVYLFFAWQGAVLLSSRFWLIIWLFSSVLWLFYILKYLFSEAPRMRKEIDHKRDFERYIP